MKFIITLLFVGIMTTGFLLNPVFVLAKNTCYVDKNAKDDSDGSSDDPYKKIEKAIDKGCKDIIVKKGTYKDAITLGGGVNVKGKNRDDVIVTGKITMKDGSSLEKITVSGSGVEVAKGADAKIKNAKIKSARIGIETVGNGKLTVDDVSFSDNQKAMYLQRGKNVKITGCKVYNNDEEGIDIRANVDGVISGNEIYSNGESGIEVILGKSDLTISNNSIKKNGSSGIAAQYYKSASKLGGVKITGNTITGNKDFGINCKTPSGGNPGADYWSASINMSSNKVSNNKDGEFSSTCYFDDEKVSDATKTKEQKEQEARDLEEAQKQAQLDQQKKEQEIKAEQEKKQAQEEREKKEQGELRQKLQHEKELQTSVETFNNEISVLYDGDAITQEEIKSRSKILLFVIGPDYKKLQEMAQHIEQYDEKVEQASSTKNEITDIAITERVQENIVEMTEKRNSVRGFVEEYNNTFSIYGWFFKRIA
ncbi:MAG: right-handed parallel beta-helix repeat-containing protein [Patescibacteria group bacterium]|nr:right-handed parallel beta-helix repeat-containing protein [Patescibacteria group bacterium]